MKLLLAISFLLVGCGQAIVSPPSNMFYDLHHDLPNPTVTYQLPTDIHAGMIFEANGSVYWIGDTYGCGYVLGAPDSKYCGEVGYQAASINGPWYGPVLLFDPSTWQARCGAPNYGCFRPHVVWNPNTNDWRLWVNVASTFNTFGFAVFKSPYPLGPYEYVGDAKLSVHFDVPRYGDETLFVDGNQGYAAYTTIAKEGTHAIAIEQLDPTFQFGTGRATLMSIPQWVESPSIFKHEGRYFVAYSDPVCAFCTSSGTSYAVGSSPLGPWQEIRHSITRTSCNGQVAAVNEINGEFIYQSDLWNGSMNETLAKQWWEPLRFIGSTIQPITCGIGG